MEGVPGYVRAAAKRQLYEIWREVSSGGGSAFAPWSAQAVQQVEERHERVGEQHARPGVAHHCADAFAFFRRVAMDRAFAAGGLVVLERAVAQSFVGVVKQFPAICAEFSLTPVAITAVTADHGRHGARFALQTS